MGRRWVLATAGSLAGFMGIVIAVMWMADGFGIIKGRVAPGVIALGQSVAFLSKEDVSEAVRRKVEEIREAPLDIVYEDRTYSSRVKDAGYKIDENGLVEHILGYGSSGSYIRRLLARFDSRKRGYDVPLDDVSSLEHNAYLEEIERQVGTPVQNAYWKISWGITDEVREGHFGRILDYSRLEDRITQALLDNLDNLDNGIRVQLPLTRVEPEVDAQDIANMREVSSFTTKFDPTVVNRVKNIRLAVDRLIGQIVKPGKTWSLNDAVGPRSEKRGYKEAIVILEGKFVKGIGGGVSQVTTTVFNAALLAGMEVVEHFSHTIPIAYVPFGLDATAVYGVKDLKLRTRGSSIVSITAAVSNDKLRVKMYSDEASTNNIEVAARIIEKYEPKVDIVEDDSIRTGYEVVEQQAVPGYRVAVDRVFRDSLGNVVQTEVAANAWYRTIDGRVRRGANPLGAIPAVEAAEPAGAPVTESQDEAITDQKSNPASAGLKGFVPKILDMLLDELAGE